VETQRGKPKMLETKGAKAKPRILEKKDV